VAGDRRQLRLGRLASLAGSESHTRFGLGAAILLLRRQPINRREGRSSDLEVVLIIQIAGRTIREPARRRPELLLAVAGEQRLTRHVQNRKRLLALH
jgi:hypothetical protein